MFTRWVRSGGFRLVGCWHSPAQCYYCVTQNKARRLSPGAIMQDIIAAARPLFTCMLKLLVTGSQSVLGCEDGSVVFRKDRQNPFPGSISVRNTTRSYHLILQLHRSILFFLNVSRRKKLKLSLTSVELGEGIR